MDRWHGFLLGCGFIIGMAVGLSICPHRAYGEPMAPDAPRPSWGDEDGDCIDTRHQILIRDAYAYSVRMSENGCRVVAGLWADPYSGVFIDGNPGGNPHPIEIDHILPQSRARKMRRWTREEFESFYRDPLNLTVSSTAANQLKKGRMPLTEWMPDNPAARCWLVSRVDAVRRKYRLAFKPLEMVALKEWQERCD